MGPAIAKPKSEWTNCTTSKNPFGSSFRKFSDHVLHPSFVLYSLLFSPGPLAITIAVVASHACTPRKSSVAPSLSASGTAHFCQCAPPSVVLSTVPPVPLAQATLPSTESMPRRPAVVPESCICQTGLTGRSVAGGICTGAGVLDWAAAIAEAAISSVNRITCMGGSIVARIAAALVTFWRITFGLHIVSGHDFSRAVKSQI